MDITTLLHRLQGFARRSSVAARQEEGQGMVEYAFILVLVVIGLILVVTTIGKQDQTMWSNITNGLNGH